MDRLAKSSVMGELESIYKEGLSMIQPFDIAGTLKGRLSINQQVKALFKKADKYINMLTTEAGLEEIHSRHFKTLKKASKNGVQIRILAPSTNSKGANALSEIGKVKNIDKPMGRMITVDGEHFMLALTDDKTVHETQDVAFWAGSGHVAKDVLEPFFENIWTMQKV
jgi:sugar-specific transcriptional regulator TrmB